MDRRSPKSGVGFSHTTPAPRFFDVWSTSDEGADTEDGLGTLSVFKRLSRGEKHEDFIQIEPLNSALLCKFLSLQVGVKANDTGLDMTSHPLCRLTDRATNLNGRIIQHFNPFGRLASLVHSHNHPA
jgi:hypothetical protein